MTPGVLTWCCWSLAIGLLLLSSMMLLLLRRHNLAARLVSVSDFSQVRSNPLAAADAERLKARFCGDTPVSLLQQVVNSVKEIEAGPQGSPGSILDHIERGGGLLCSGMACLYAAALSANGLENRMVYLSRNFPDRSDSHVTVEVRQEQRWVIFDPTFNFTVMRGRVPQGAEEIHQALLGGSAGDLCLLQYPPGRYPGRLERQALHWLPLFNNIYVLDSPEGWLAKVPPLRYWYGPRILVKALAGHPNEHAECLNAIYHVACVVLPVASLALLLLGAIGVLVGWP